MRIDGMTGAFLAAFALFVLAIACCAGAAAFNNLLS